MKYITVTFILVMLVLLSSCHRDDYTQCVNHNVDVFFNDALILEASDYRKYGEVANEIFRYDFLINYCLSSKEVIEKCGYSDFTRLDPVVDLNIYKKDIETNESQNVTCFLSYPWFSYNRVTVDELIEPDDFELNNCSQFLLFRPDSVLQFFYLKGEVVLASVDSLTTYKAFRIV